MNKLPETVDKTLYVYLTDGGRVHASEYDFMESEGWVLLGSETVTLSVPRVNPVEIELGMLDKKESVIRAKFEEAMGNIKGRRAELLSLTYQPEGAA